MVEFNEVKQIADQAEEVMRRHLREAVSSVRISASPLLPHMPALSRRVDRDHARAAPAPVEGEPN